MHTCGEWLKRRPPVPGGSIFRGPGTRPGHARHLGPGCAAHAPTAGLPALLLRLPEVRGCGVWSALRSSQLSPRRPDPPSRRARARDVGTRGLLGEGSRRGPVRECRERMEGPQSVASGGTSPSPIPRGTPGQRPHLGVCPAHTGRSLAVGWRWEGPGERSQPLLVCSDPRRSPGCEGSA